MLNKTQPVIQTEHLSRTFGRVAAVKDLNLCVPAGSIYGFLGPNGAGKTTTIRMLLGLIRPSQGEVRLFGRYIDREPTALLRRVGSLVETPSLYPNLTGRENLEVLQRCLGFEQSAVQRALHIVRLEAEAHRLVKGYSLGMRQRLGLAMALLPSPDLLILDEPTNGLDPAGIAEMRELLVRLVQEQGITVFLSSHLLNEVEQIATCLGIIQDGRLIFQGSPDDLQARLQETVSLGVDQPEMALEMLTVAGWSAHRNGNQRLVINANGMSDAAMINNLLVRQGLNIYHLSLQRPSLEDIFLKLTEKSAA